MNTPEQPVRVEDSCSVQPAGPPDSPSEHLRILVIHDPAQFGHTTTLPAAF